MRVKIEYSGNNRPKLMELEKYFLDKVANRGEVFKLKKKVPKKYYPEEFR